MWLVSGWIISYAISLSWVIFGVQRLRIVNRQKQSMSLDELTVVIPFRNEATNLPQLIDAIRRQRYQPEQWIFVNDHSSDDFMPLFNELVGFPVRLLHLPEDQRGKKRAIRYGMDHARTEYCLTMDADVTFGKSYIQHMMVLPLADMVILPVEMTGTKWWQSFFIVEYFFTVLLNRGTAGWSRPVNCSGANLLVNIASFDQVDDIEAHDHILSGDDIYALRAFRESNKQIEISEKEELTVYTSTPNRLIEVLEQRTRWLGKTSHVNDNLNTFLGIWAVCLHISYFLLLLITWFAGAYWFTLFLIVFKGGLDAALLRMTIKKWSIYKWIGLVLFELGYPLYLFVLFGHLLFSQSEWKGR
jgi:cellulose synthase/poly-beta-1,6-N-acetylglucosamine synthase-like glycosyltransferase